MRQNSLQQLRPGSEDPPLPSPANKVLGQWRPFNNTQALQAHTIPKPALYQNLQIRCRVSGCLLTIPGPCKLTQYQNPRRLIPTLYHTELYFTIRYHTLPYHATPYHSISVLHTYKTFSLTYLRRHQSNTIDQDLVTNTLVNLEG